MLALLQIIADKRYCDRRMANEVERALRARKVRVTPQRVIVLETLRELSSHASAQEVYEAAAPRLPGLNLATVYRALRAMHQAGLVDLFTTDTDVQRFAHRDPDNPHSHLVCRGCGATEEIDPELLEPLTEAVRRRHEFAMDGRHLALSGLCFECQSSGV